MLVLPFLWKGLYYSSSGLCHSSSPLFVLPPLKSFWMVSWPPLPIYIIESLSNCVLQAPKWINCCFRHRYVAVMLPINLPYWYNSYCFKIQNEFCYITDTNASPVFTVPTHSCLNSLTRSTKTFIKSVSSLPDWPHLRLIPKSPGIFSKPLTTPSPHRTYLSQTSFLLLSILAIVWCFLYLRFETPSWY